MWDYKKTTIIIFRKYGPLCFGDEDGGLFAVDIKISYKKTRFTQFYIFNKMYLFGVDTRYISMLKYNMYMWDNTQSTSEETIHDKNA